MHEDRLKWYERVWFGLFKPKKVIPTPQQQRILEEQAQIREQLDLLRFEHRVPRRHAGQRTHR